MSAKRALDASLVLVVEDDALVRLYAVELLEDFGLATVEARDADEAWDILERRDDIGVLFTDIDMPGSMCGKTLAARVHASWPDIRLVPTSGRHRLADEDVPDHGLFVAKLYGTGDIVEAIVHAR
ncbi:MULTISPECIES: response regulator [unclassified Methylobacterium]|jgi:CheY-like chemotaxis protein|uniref:response regulator n=1 Tax=unclassified Methylobacterium TaxID=2615210 RepID=UPI0005BE8F27|nr:MULTISPECIES: response regulator [unclassified Methylobacterium]MDE4909528.1 response regulator [Methylobacterium sp. 092160098-2]SFU93025.1 Response regulator receiver domain-containing protein [Methylobacterium sp. UNCCL125]